MTPICVMPSSSAFLVLPLYSNDTVLIARISSSHPVNEAIFFLSLMSDVTSGADPTRLIDKKFELVPVPNVIARVPFL